MSFTRQTTVSLAITVSVLTAYAAPALAASKSSKKEKTAPAGTLLLPLTPRMDDGTAPGSLLAPRKFSAPPAPAIRTVPPPPVASKIPLVPGASPTAPKTSAAGDAPQAADVNASPVSGQQAHLSKDEVAAESLGEGAGLDGITEVDENSVLKGTVQIVADDTEYDQNKNTFLGTGNAVAIIGGQDARLEADTILYDQNGQTIDARGNVKIVRNGQLTTGSSFKFKLNSDEYLITDPDTELQGTCVVARLGKGNRKGLAFKKGDLTLPDPIHIMNNAGYGPLSASEDVMQREVHPDAYLPSRPSFVFKARKMVYEKYKEQGNLTVFGGRAVFDNFTIPVPKFSATVGQENDRVTFPVTPVIGNNIMVGGLNLGPQFNYAVGKTGQFSWAPLVQFGGRNINSKGEDRNEGKSKIGAGFRLGYSNDRLSTHLAYGSVSDILVGDFRYKFDKRGNFMFQSGINRFLNDGLFGPRRARLIGELVHNKAITSIPYISMLNFRSSGGWAQDDPSLVNLSGNAYSQLFNTKGAGGKMGAFRLQEQITVSTQPIFSVGDDKYGAQMNLFGGVVARGYSTGDTMLMGQLGPMLNVKMNRLRLMGGYTQSAVSGKSPFVFDQFIQGQRSALLSGDFKVSKYLTLGTNLGYNLNAKMLYSRAITAAIGPDDFKVLLSRDTIRGINRYGFDLIYGSKIPFDKLILKGGPDAGQLGGI